MDIEELKKRLYSKDPEFEERPESPKVFEPGTRSGEIGKKEQDWSVMSAPIKQKWQPTMKQKTFFKRFGIGLAVILVSVVVFIIWSNYFAFDKKRVSIKIYGPERIVSGEKINYIIQYKNNAKVSLDEIKLSLELPEGSFFEDDSSGGLVKTVSLPEMRSGIEGQTEFAVRIMGSRDSQKKIKVRFDYRPSNAKIAFENTADFDSLIISVPLVLDLDLPKKTVSGQKINFSVRYLNTSEVDFSDLKLRLEYPRGFTFDSADPQPSEENNIWLIDDIGAREEGRILISGVIQGERDDIESFKAELGSAQNNNLFSFAETLSSSQISLPPLNISQSVNSGDSLIADIGQVLSFKLKYQNTSDLTINGVIITAKLGGEALDWTSLLVRDDGVLNSANQTITWNASSVRQLESLGPQQEGEVFFAIKVKDKLPIKDFGDKNFIITSDVKIDSLNIPLALSRTQIGGENHSAIKVNSKLVLDTKGFYQDNLFSNSGPIPPRVGQMTTYTIYWQITNVSNDVENTQVWTYLPSYMHWTGEFEPKNSDLKYDPSTGKIVWHIDKVDAATGILSPVKYAAFKIGLVPSINQVGKQVDLIKESIIEAIDSFTSARLTMQSSALSSKLPDDSSIGPAMGIVSE